MTDRDDRTWFRTHLDPVVGADPSPDAWAAISARADGTASAAAPPDALSARQGGHRLLGIAAAIALLAGAVIAARFTSRDDHGSSAVHTSPTSSDAATGWYVPEGLPPGWRVGAVTALPGHGHCARHGVQWTDPGHDRSVSVSFDACGGSTAMEPPPEATVVDVPLGDGVTGALSWLPDQGRDLPPMGSIDWPANGGRWRVAAIGVTKEQVVAMATGLRLDPDGSTPPLDGLEQVDRWTAPKHELHPEVQVDLTSPDGLLASYHLTLPGDGIKPAGTSVVLPVTGADAVGLAHPLVRYESPTFWAGRFGGSWPGADLISFRWTTGPTDAEHLMSDGDLLGMLRTLRPATAQEWQRFLDRATAVSPVLRERATLEDLAASSFEHPGATPSTTTAETTTATDPAPPPAKVTSEPGTARPNDTTAPSFTPLDGIEIRLELADDTIGVEPVAATLVYRNTTDQDVELTECTRLKTTWALVPESEPDAPLPDHQIVDCYRTGRPDLAAGATMRVPLEWSPGGFVARSWGTDRNGFDTYAGTLPAGRYLAVVDVPGDGSIVRITLPVTVPAPSCPMSDELALRWRGRPIGAATTEAEAEGLRVVVVSDEQGEQPTTQELDCTRLKASTGGGYVYEYLLG